MQKPRHMTSAYPHTMLACGKTGYMTGYDPLFPRCARCISNGWIPQTAEEQAAQFGKRVTYLTLSETPEVFAAAVA